MARLLLAPTRMKVQRLIAAFALLIVAALPVAAQEIEPPDGTKINSAQISGVDPERVSQGIRDDIAKLVGTPLNRQQLKDLAARIEAEQPRFVVGTRLTQDPDGGARVVFVIARVREQGVEANINARYNVEDVSLRGVNEQKLSQGLRDELHAMEGKPFDSDAAERVQNKLKDELPGNNVSRRTERGDQTGTIKLIYTIERTESSRWLRFEPIDGNALYHTDLGWGAVLPMAIDTGDWRVTPILTLDDADSLVEENSGFGVRVESRKLGTDRLGMMFEWSGYDSKWRSPTVAALAFRPDLPGLYGARMNVTPMLKFAITRQLSIAGGVDIVELGSFTENGPSDMANAATGAIRYYQQWTPGNGIKHQAGGVFSFRGGTDSLQSDFTYQRYFGQADYAVNWGKQWVLVMGQGGSIDGNAPLFERFTLGDSRNLRGWNKYDISPVGTDRMFATSVEYRYSGFMMFFDAGSVWDAGTTKQIRTSAGFGWVAGPFFGLVGFPLNTNDFRAVFTTGFRFGLPPSGVKKF